MKIKISLLLLCGIIASADAYHSLHLDNPCKVTITDCDTEGENFFDAIKSNNTPDVKRSLAELQNVQPNILQDPNFVNDLGLSPVAYAL